MNQATILQTETHLLPVAVVALRNATELEFDLYIQASPTAVPRLYRRRYVPIKPADIDRLLESGIKTLYVPASMATHYGSYLRERVLADTGLPLAQRYEVLKEAARAPFEQALEVRDVDSLARVSGEFGRQIAELLVREQVLLLDVLEEMLRDYSAFTHSSHVATYAVMLAMRLGISRSEELQAIATGALLHDAGKHFYVVRPLAKTARRGVLHQELMRTHPTRGFEALCQRQDITWGGLMMVYQHHERYDGSGYPVGLVGRESHEWARICAVANELDARLSQHACRDEASLDDALEHIGRQGGRGFDEEIVQCLIAIAKQRG